jgi:hypothetical protein
MAIMHIILARIGRYRTRKIATVASLMGHLLELVPTYGSSPFLLHFTKTMSGLILPFSWQEALQ